MLYLFWSVCEIEILAITIIIQNPFKQELCWKFLAGYILYLLSKAPWINVALQETPHHLHNVMDIALSLNASFIWNITTFLQYMKWNKYTQYIKRNMKLISKQWNISKRSESWSIYITRLPYKVFIKEFFCVVKLRLWITYFLLFLKKWESGTI